MKNLVTLQARSPPPLFCESPSERAASSGENLLPLIIEICRSVDNIKAGDNEVDVSKPVAVSPLLFQIACIDYCPETLAGRHRHVRGDQSADRLNDVLQRTAIVLVVLEQLCFYIGGFGSVPGVSPDYSLQSGRVVTCPLKTQKTSDIFKAVRINREIDVLMYKFPPGAATAFIKRKDDSVGREDGRPSPIPIAPKHCIDMCMYAVVSCVWVTGCDSNSTSKRTNTTSRDTALISQPPP